MIFGRRVLSTLANSNSGLLETTFLMWDLVKPKWDKKLTTKLGSFLTGFKRINLLEVEMASFFENPIEFIRYSSKKLLVVVVVLFSWG